MPVDTYSMSNDVDNNRTTKNMTFWIISRILKEVLIEAKEGVQTIARFSITGPALHTRNHAFHIE